MALRVHRALDYAVIAVFFAAPSVLGMDSTAEQLSYGLALFHFAMTLITDVPYGIEWTIHGRVELAAAPAIIIAPWLLGFAQETVARYFFIAAGAAILWIRQSTDYSAG